VLNIIRNTHCRARVPRTMLSGLLLVAAGALMLGGCPRDSDKAPEHATIAYIGRFRGFQRPCGCATSQYGGLPRLGSIMQALSAQLNGEPSKVMPAAPGGHGKPAGHQAGTGASTSEGIPTGGSSAGQPTAGSSATGASSSSSAELPPGDPPAGEKDAPAQTNTESTSNAPAGDSAADAGTVSAELPDWLELPQPVWLIDCGDFSFKQMVNAGLRSKTHLRILAHLGARAAVIGGDELRLDEEQALTAFTAAPLPLVTCNVNLRIDGFAFVPYVVLADGWALVGVTSWKPSPTAPPDDSWWELLDPVASVRSVLDELDGQQVIVAALHQPDEVIQALAGLPVAAVIGYDPVYADDWPEGHAPVYPPPAGKAKELNCASLSADASATAHQPWGVLVDGKWPDDPGVMELIGEERLEALEQLKAKRADSGQSGPQGWRDIEWSQSEAYLPESKPWENPAAAGPYAGAQWCRKCHGVAYDIWLKSAHSHALDSLKEKGEDTSLDCLKCHVVALLEPGGYDPLNPRDEVSHVGCEECHGPGAEHAALAKNPPADVSDWKIERALLTVCLKCHDDYNSPRFKAETYWKQIAH